MRTQEEILDRLRTFLIELNSSADKVNSATSALDTIEEARRLYKLVGEVKALKFVLELDKPDRKV